MPKRKEPETLTTFDAAFEFAGQQVRRLVERYPDQFVAHTVQGHWITDPAAWSGTFNGLLPGMMWIFHEATGEAWWAETAEQYSRAVQPLKALPQVGLGLVFYYGSHRRWHEATVRVAASQAQAVEVMQEAARTLAGRFSNTARCLLTDPAAPVLAIEDLMNVPLILHVANLLDDDSLLTIGSQHVATSRRHLVRGDGSTVGSALMGDYRERTGRIDRTGWQQDSCWARGQAWAVYGFATCGRLLGFGPWLETARQCAYYLIEKLSGDPIPSWDLDAPPGAALPRDSSAAAIAAAGFLELVQAEHTVGSEQARQRRYLQDAALRILTALCEPEYLAIDDPNWEGILKHGVGDLERGLAVDESVIWGDFFFAEALHRARGLLRAKRH
ncbi:MAG: hypothetical protein ACUVXJ_16270 [Phycisphaerae bacterium]